MGACGWIRGRRLAGYDVVRVLRRILLLTAASRFLPVSLLGPHRALASGERRRRECGVALPDNTWRE